MLELTFLKRAMRSLLSWRRAVWRVVKVGAGTSVLQSVDMVVIVELFLKVFVPVLVDGELSISQVLR